jgi:hypothetical protein
MDQLKTIFRALGTPTEEEWPVRFFFFSFLAAGKTFFLSSPLLAPSETHSNHQTLCLSLFLFFSFPPP